MGGRNSRSKSYENSTDYGNEVWQGQQPYMNNIYSQAQQTYQNRNDQPMYDTANQWRSSLDQGMAGYQQGMGQLAQAGQGYQQGYNQLAQANQGYQQGYGRLDEAANAYRQFLQPQGANPMLDVYAQAVGRNFNEQVMPGIRGDAMVAGGYGGSRAQIGSALAVMRSQEQMQNFAAQLYSDDMNRALSAAGGLSNNAMGYGTLAQGQGNLGGQYGALAQGQGGLGAQYGALAQGMGNMGSQYGALGNYQAQIPWVGLQQYQDIVGAPVMKDLGSVSNAGSRSFNRGFGMNTG